MKILDSSIALGISIVIRVPLSSSSSSKKVRNPRSIRYLLRKPLKPHRVSEPLKLIKVEYLKAFGPSKRFWVCINWNLKFRGSANCDGMFWDRNGPNYDWLQLTLDNTKTYFSSQSWEALHPGPFWRLASHTMVSRLMPRNGILHNLVYVNSILSSKN